MSHKHKWQFVEHDKDILWGTRWIPTTSVRNGKIKFVCHCGLTKKVKEIEVSK